MAENKKKQWIEIGTVITILIPMFYTAGWSYAYHYFEKFHLGLIGLDIPKEYLFLYSFWAVRDNIVMFAAMLPVVAGIYFLSDRMIQKNTAGTDKTAAIFQIFFVMLMPVVVLGIFWLFYFFGETAAEKTYVRQVINDFPSYARVKIWVKPDKENNITEAMTQEWQNGCYRLLLRNKENLYVFYPGEKGDRTPTDIIPVSKIEGVRVLPVYESCKP